MHRMTRLYRLDAQAADIADAFGARARDDPWAGGYVAPEKFAPIITAGRDFIAGPRPANRAVGSRSRSNSGAVAQTRMVPRLWGVLPPPNSDDPTRRIASVRNTKSPFWIGNLRNSEFRCLIPTTAIMIWGRGTDYEGRRIKHWVGLERSPIFAMLGVWKDEEVPAFAVVTQAAGGVARTLGSDTMPIVVAPTGRAAQTWLHGGWDSAQTLLKTASAQALIEIAAPPS